MDWNRGVLLDLGHASMGVVNSFILQEWPAYSHHMRPAIIVHQEEARTYWTVVESDNKSKEFFLIANGIID